ncbi:LuxR C-terminal-related transcriptional regulator [Kutzneria sp. NPDC052558]|uniref:helix-turn-helix transcriptional regulator n=1 Tax=Kutzneria sp. NPDC052558 TaxID=3364121 RepID=UPI0037CAF46F
MTDLSAVDGTDRSALGHDVAQLMAVHDRCVRESRPALVTVVAHAGHGKTRTLDGLTRRVEVDGTLVLRASPTPGERQLAFAVIEQLLATPALEGPFRCRLQAQLNEIAAATPQLSSERPSFPIGTANGAPLREFFQVFAELAAQTPVMAIVDDFQDADPPSVELLLHIGRRLRHLPLMLVFAERPELMPAHPELRSRVVREATDHLRLSVVPDVSEYGLPADWLDISGGNPGLVRALVCDHLAGGRWPGDAFDTTVSGWVHSQDPLLVEVVSVLAASPASDRDTITRLVGIDRDTVDRALTFLAEGLPARPEPPLHPALAAAVLRALPADRRVRLHQDVARALYDSGAEGDLVVDQIVAAGHSDDEWAFALLWTAADRALAAGRLTTAMDLLRLGLRGKVTDRQRARALVAFARIEYRNNPAGARRYFGRMVEAALNGHCEDRDLSATVKYLLWHGAYGPAARVLDFWCTAVADGRRPACEEVRKTVAWSRFSHFQLVEMVPSMAAIGPAPGAAVTQRLLGIQAVSNVVAGAPAQPWISDAEQILRHSRLSDDPSLGASLEPLQGAILTLLYAGRLDLAAQRADELMARVASLDAVTWLAAVSSVRAEIAVRRGEPQLAVNYARRALKLIDNESWGVMIGLPLASLVHGLIETGQHEEVARTLAVPVPDVLFGSRPGLIYLGARAAAAAAQEDWHGALRDYERCGTIMRNNGIDLPAVENWRTGAAWAHLRLGRPDLAVALVQELLELPGGDLPGVRGPALRVLAAAADQPKARLELLSEAVRLLSEESGSRLELSRALHDLSQAHQDVGQGSRSRMLAEQAARRRASSLAPVAPPDDTPAVAGAVATLSEAERRVAVLAATGNTNRAVADALFITVSTVEQHLTRIYRKLNVTRRRELTTKFRQELMAADAVGQRSS